MSNAPSGPIRATCPACGHPLLVEVWTRADTVTGRMVDEVVIVNPMSRQPTDICPGCRGSVEPIAQRYRPAD